MLFEIAFAIVFFCESITLNEGAHGSIKDKDALLENIT